MAYLLDSRGRYILESKLKRLKSDSGWIGYELNILDPSENNNILFCLPHIDTLYFENEIEPEVPMSLRGIKEILDCENSIYIFEPIDERDFRLEIEKNYCDIFVNIWSGLFKISDCKKLPSRLEIGVRLIVNEKDLQVFADELSDEYRKITA